MHVRPDPQREVTDEFLCLMVALDRLVDGVTCDQFARVPEGLRERLIVLMHAHLVFRDLCARYDTYVVRERMPSPMADRSN